MARLSSADIQTLVDLLEPELRDEKSRRAVFDLVFTGNRSRPNLDLSGGSHETTLRIVLRLSDFGALESGTPALWAFCEVVMPQIGADRQAKLLALRDKIAPFPTEFVSESIDRPQSQPGQLQRNRLRSTVIAAITLMIVAAVILIISINASQSELPGSRPLAQAWLEITQTVRALITPSPTVTDTLTPDASATLLQARTEVSATLTAIAPTVTPLGGGGGEIIFTSQRDGSGLEIYLMNNDGSNVRQLTHNFANANDPTWSLDRRKILFTSTHDGDAEIYVMNSDGSAIRQLTDNDRKDYQAKWSPDGAKIVFVSERDGNPEIWVMNADGSNPFKSTNTDPPTRNLTPDWSPDGTKIAYSSDLEGYINIFLMTPYGLNQRRILNNNTANNWIPVWSPDGSRISFDSERDGNIEVYTMKNDGSEIRRLTNNPAEDGDTSWSPDGTKIAFFSVRDGDQELYVMDADGSNVRRLTSASGIDGDAAWKP